MRLDEETGTATVIVSDFQLSLAIGKEGQNARLAARLTGWRIDIKSETQLAEEEAGGTASEDWAEGEWIEDEKGELVWKPAEGGEAMSAEEWTHQAEDPAEEVVTVTEAADGSVTVEDVEVTESADGSVTVEDVKVTKTPDGDVIVDDLVVTESADGEVTVDEVVVVEDGRRRGRRRRRGIRRGRGIAPTRTCVGCRNALPADQLIRIVRLPGGALSVDRHGAGRGAWLCRASAGCLDEAVRRHGFERALRASVGAEDLQQLRVQLGGAWERPAPDVRG